MADYSPRSSIGWLDHSVRDTERMRELISAFRDRRSIDNLGVGIVRDAISNQLFPGISTIQTRARYFLFVPWLCRQLEAERVTPGDFPRRYRRAELALVDRLIAAGETEGVIGRQARGNLKRLAIEVYWGGLGSYRIRRLDGSISEYHRTLPALYRYQQTATRRDDDGNALGPEPSAWDPALPPPPADFRDQTGLALPADEAIYLANAMKRSHPGSLLARLTEVPPVRLAVHRIADLREDDVPEGQRALWLHAELFAIAIQPARALYNLLLARRSSHPDSDEVAALAESELDRYRRMRQGLDAELESWIADLEAFWSVVDPDRSIPLARRTSIETLLRLCHRHAANLENAEVVHREIENTERRLKGRLARLTSSRALETWTGQPFGVGDLDYRWRTARRILTDIAEGLA